MYSNLSNNSQNINSNNRFVGKKRLCEEVPISKNKLPNTISNSQNIDPNRLVGYKCKFDYDSRKEVPNNNEPINSNPIQASVNKKPTDPTNSEVYDILNFNDFGENLPTDYDNCYKNSDSDCDNLNGGRNVNTNKFFGDFSDSSEYYSSDEDDQLFRPVNKLPH